MVFSKSKIIDNIGNIVVQISLETVLSYLVLICSLPLSEWSVHGVDDAVASWRIGKMRRLFATVVYVLPDYDELRRVFGGYVNPYYNGVVFTPIRSCRKVVRFRRKVEFVYVDMFNRSSTEEVLDEMSTIHARPALPEELLCFNREHPSEMLKYPIVAQGAVAIINDLSFVAFIDSVYGKRNFRLALVESPWEKRCRHLAVPIDGG